MWSLHALLSAPSRQALFKPIQADPRNHIKTPLARTLSQLAADWTTSSIPKPWRKRRRNATCHPNLLRPRSSCGTSFYGTLSSTILQPLQRVYPLGRHERYGPLDLPGHTRVGSLLRYMRIVLSPSDKTRSVLRELHQHQNHDGESPSAAQIIMYSLLELLSTHQPSQTQHQSPSILTSPKPNPPKYTRSTQPTNTSSPRKQKHPIATQTISNTQHQQNHRMTANNKPK